MNRREFLNRTCAGLIGLAGLPLLTKLSWAAGTGGGPADVNLVYGEVAAATRRAIEIMGGMSRFVKSGDKVVLKANLGFSGGPVSASTTSPQLIRTVADLVLAAGASEIVLVENSVMNIESCWKQSGAAEILAGLSRFRFVRLTDDSAFQTINVSRGKSLTETDISKDLMEADVFINLPQAKSHGSAGVSLSLKNYMGLVRDRGYFHSNDLDQCIADVATVISCDLVILDATRALLTGGPGGPGKVSYPGWVAAGSDVVAMDSYAVGSIPFYNRNSTGDAIGHIKAAYKHNLGQISSTKISVRTEKIS